MYQIDFPRKDEAYFDFIVSLKNTASQFVYTAIKDEYQQRSISQPQSHRHTPEEIKEMVGELPAYKFNRAVVRKAQEMMWDSVIEAYQPYEAEVVAWLNQPHPEAASTLRLDPQLALPDYFASTEFHIQPGGYYGRGDISAAIFEKGGNLYFRKTTAGFRIQRELARKLPPGNYQRILDLGCTDGGSTIAFKLEHPQAEVHAIDLSAPMLKLAYQQSVQFEAPCHFSQQNAQKMDFPDNYFDAVVCFILFHEVPPAALRTILAEARRVLKPGGVMYSGDVTPFRENEPFRSFISSWEVENNGEPYWREVLEKTYMPDLFSEAGFSDIREFGVAASKLSPKFPWVTLGYKPAR